METAGWTELWSGMNDCNSAIRIPDDSTQDLPTDGFPLEQMMFEK
jgi:hypothetical protein